jgi:hypothetical protein
MMDFAEAFNYGTGGEKIVAEALRSRGAFVYPTHQGEYETAPSLFGANGVKLAVPDMMSFQNGRQWFVEVKRKQRWVEYKGPRETGFDLHSLGQYVEVYAKTRMEMEFYFVHEVQEPTGIFFIDLVDVALGVCEGGVRFWDGKKSPQKKPLVLIRNELLTRLCDLPSGRPG